MLETRFKYRCVLRLAVLLAFLVMFGSCGSIRKLFHKAPQVDRTHVSSEGLNSYNDSVRQGHLVRFRDSCALALQAERDSLLRMAPSSMEWKVLADSIIEYAIQYMGKPYKPGSTGPSMFDCSGFTWYVFKHFGYHLPRTTVGQSRDGTEIDNPADLRRGDLVFYGSRKNPQLLGHVGIVVDNNPELGYFTFIHATVKIGVTISKSTETYYKHRYLTACRTLPD